MQLDLFVDQPQSPLPRRLDRRQAAEYLGVTYELVCQWAAQRRELPYTMIGRKAYYEVSDLDPLLKAGRREPKPSLDTDSGQ